MAEDTRLEIVIQALLDAKGFEEAKENLSALTAATNKSAPATEGFTKGQKDLTKAVGGTRGGVADLTRILLMNIGVTGPAGQVAKAAGTSISFMGGAATVASVAVTGLVAGFAVGIPLIIQWIRASRDQTAEQERLKEILTSTIPSLREYADTVREANAELVKLADLERSQARQKQRAEIADLAQAIVDKTKAMEQELLGTVQLSTESGRLTAGFRQHLEVTEENREAADKLAVEIADLITHMNALNAAESEGLVAGDMVSTGLAAEEKARRRVAAAIQEQIDRSFRLMNLSVEGQNAIQEAEDERSDFIEKQAKDADKDMRDFGRKQQVDVKNRLKTEREYQLAVGALQRSGLAIDREVAAQKAAIAAATVDYLGASLTALSSAFGGNKALAIAGAIANTWAGAARALGPEGPPWPANIAAAAMVAATGLAAVVNIRKAEPGGAGFDDPFADLTARKLGQKSAVDFVRNFGGAFAPGVVAGMGAMGAVSNTTINRGTTINMGGIHGALGPRPAFDKWLERAMTRAERSRSRTTVGR